MTPENPKTLSSEECYRRKMAAEDVNDFLEWERLEYEAKKREHPIQAWFGLIPTGGRL